jgi:hypothetical protein
MRPILKLRVLGVQTALILALTSSEVFSQIGGSYTFQSCRISFATVGQPVLVKIEGVSALPCKGRLEVMSSGEVQGELEMPLTEIDTGIGLRNKHLRENYLHVEKHPKAVMRSIRLEDLVSQIEGRANQNSGFSAAMELSGQVAPIREGTYRLIRKGGALEVEADFKLELQDHKIDRPSFMGVQVVDAVEIHVSGKLK